MHSLAYRRGQLGTFLRVLRHFTNPLMVVLLRAGLVRLRYFLYRLEVKGKTYEMLGRPATNAMADLFVLREVLVDEAYGEIIKYLPDSPLRWLDVGGNMGTFSIWLSKYKEAEKAYIFEPTEDSLKLLRFNVSNNHCKNLEVVGAAVGGTARKMSMSLDPNRPGGCSIYSEASDADSVDVLSFSDWMGEVSGDFDLMKLDCEGAEWEILDSPEAVRHLQRIRVIVAEVHADPMRPRDINEFEQKLVAIGFKTIRWDGRPFGFYLGVREP